MRYSLMGELVRGGGHDDDKRVQIEEYFEADNLETAIIIARAMVQSQKLREQKDKNQVVSLSAKLNNNTGQEVWKIKLIPELTKPVVITEEHFEDELIVQ